MTTFEKSSVLLIGIFGLLALYLKFSDRVYARTAEPVVPMYWSTQVDVLNTSGLGRFAFGESCFARSGDPVSKVKVDGDKVLVRLQKARLYPELEDACPPGTLFLVDAWQYVHTSDAIRNAKAEADAKRERYARILEGVGK